jgi:hypothetical protein
MHVRLPDVTNFQVLLAYASLIPAFLPGFFYPLQLELFRVCDLAVHFVHTKIMDIQFKRFR